jgi:excisionase family DNA binding protein
MSQPTQTPDPPSPLARVAEVARYLACGRTQVYALMRSGQLPYVQIGGSRRIPWDALRAYVARNTRGDGAPSAN